MFTKNRRSHIVKIVEVLIVVDVENALSSGDLGSNVYLIDNNKYCGSGAEGQSELQTQCYDTQHINWRVVAVAPDDDVEITGFSGAMISNNVCKPQKQGTGDDVYWTGTVETEGSVENNVQYSVNISMNNGAPRGFDPFLNVSIYTGAE